MSEETTHQVTPGTWDNHWKDALAYYCSRLTARVQKGLPSGAGRDTQVPIIMGNLLAYLDADAAIRLKLQDSGPLSREEVAGILAEHGIIGRGTDPEWCQFLLGTRQVPSRGSLIRSLDL
jgi:hypothetical protein